MAVISPGGGARRSRRGYYFQDLCAVRLCCQMLDGAWTQITPDGLEDICCENGPAVRYVQVKTEEHPAGPWTIAKLSQPERSGDSATSILGRLFVGKPLRDATAFSLLLNSPVAPELRPLLVGSSENRTSTIDNLTGRLTGVEPLDGRSARWCLERLGLEVVASDADGLEAMLLRDLCAVLIRYQIGLLLHESELLLEGIVAFVQGRSRPASATPITTLEFDRELQTRANEAIRGTATAQGPDAPTLTQKLNAAGIRGQQTAPMHDDHFAFSREHRSALPERAAVLDELVSRIRMQCVSLTLRLQEGTLNPGAEMFAATEAAVRDVWVAGGFEHKGISLSLAYGALHDITARCQHRYAS